MFDYQRVPLIAQHYSVEIAVFSGVWQRQACLGGHEEVVRQLLAKGASAKDRWMGIQPAGVLTWFNYCTFLLTSMGSMGNHLCEKHFDGFLWSINIY
jgi:hypothetical protein